MIHDWQQLLRDLKAMYRQVEGRELKNNKLGLMIGLEHQSVGILEKRGEPRYTVAIRILEWHAVYLRKTSPESANTLTQRA